MIAVQKMLDELGLHFPKRLEDPDAEDAWVGSWIRAFKNYQPWVLEAATVRIIEGRSERSHPIIADVKKVCADVLRDDADAKPELRAAPPGPGDVFKLANELIRGDLGKRAARDGWVLTLRDFIVKHQRLPENRIEIDRIISTRDLFLAKLNDCIEGRGGFFGHDLVKLGKSMARREYEIAQRILGENAADWYLGKIVSAPAPRARDVDAINDATVALTAPDRPFMEAMQDAAVRTADGFTRHTQRGRA
jgi:hypothetical protein